MQQFLYFLPLPHGHGSFLPIFGCSLLKVSGLRASSGFGAACGICPVPDPTDGPLLTFISESSKSSFRFCPPEITCLRCVLVFTVTPKQYLTVSSLMSPIISSNMSKPSFEYAIAGSMWPRERRPIPCFKSSIASM